MGGFITVHSFRGGTGKSVVTANLAVLNSILGKGSCIMDLDFRAPTLASMFKVSPEWWINDYLNGACEVDRVLVDLTDRYATKGRFLIAPASTEMDAIRSFAVKDRKWEINALKRLMASRSRLIRELKLDKVFLDTSPGIHYMSINALVSSDVAVIVTTLEESDFKGTRDMIKYFYRSLESVPLILLNKVIYPDVSEEELKTRFERILGAPVIGVLGCYCDLVRYGKERIIVAEMPDHPFTGKLKSVLEAIEDHL